MKWKERAWIEFVTETKMELIWIHSQFLTNSLRNSLSVKCLLNSLPISSQFLSICFTVTSSFQLICSLVLLVFFLVQITFPDSFTSPSLIIWDQRAHFLLRPLPKKIQKKFKLSKDVFLVLGAIRTNLSRLWKEGGSYRVSGLIGLRVLLFGIIRLRWFRTFQRNALVY